MEKSPNILIHDPVCPEIAEDDEMDIVRAETDLPIPVIRPPPGFRKFSWPREEWGPDGDLPLFSFSKELPGWFPWGYGGQSVDPPSLPISPILQNSLDDSVVANVGFVQRGVEHSVRSHYRHTDYRGRYSGRNGFRYPGGYAVSRCGQTVLGVAGGSCHRSTGLFDWSGGSSLSGSCPSLAAGSGRPLPCGTIVIVTQLSWCRVRISEYDISSLGLCVPLHHPRLLQWIGLPELAGLLEMGPGRRLHSLTRDQAMDAAIQLQWDVCLMTTNPDQYALSLQGTASKMLELGLDSRGFPSAEVAAAALGPRVRRTSVQMEAMGLWRPSLDPVMLS